ncbi:hypothetical protein DXT63_15675 [Thermoanaerobacteraceae bacterium SP2]|nr:hypothetical protein DXT63_15675 [Thermoanaerobacteraceae bacterium SP2]
MRIHHFGIVVRNISKSLELYKALGYEQETNYIFDDVQHNKLMFIKKNKFLIELIEPINNLSAVFNEKNLGYHHICYEVDDLDKYIKDFSSLGIGKIFTNKIKAPAFNDRYIVFAILKDGSLIEILEGDKNV